MQRQKGLTRYAPVSIVCSYLLQLQNDLLLFSWNNSLPIRLYLYIRLYLLEFLWKMLMLYFYVGVEMNLYKFISTPALGLPLQIIGCPVPLSLIVKTKEIIPDLRMLKFQMTITYDYLLRSLLLYEVQSEAFHKYHANYYEQLQVLEQRSRERIKERHNTNRLLIITRNSSSWCSYDIKEYEAFINKKIFPENGNAYTFLRKMQISCQEMEQKLFSAQA